MRIADVEIVPGNYDGGLDLLPLLRSFTTIPADALLEILVLLMAMLAFARGNEF